jgi:hypothetical protein
MSDPSSSVIEPLAKRQKIIEDSELENEPGCQYEKEIEDEPGSNPVDYNDSLDDDKKKFIMDFLALKKYKCFRIIYPIILDALQSAALNKKLITDSQIKEPAALNKKLITDSQIEEPLIESKIKEPVNNIFDTLKSKNNPPIIIYHRLTIGRLKKYQHAVDPVIITFKMTKGNICDGEYHLHRRARTLKMKRKKSINVTKFISHKIVDDCIHLIFKIDEFVKHNAQNKISQDCFLYEPVDTIYDLCVFKHYQVFCGSFTVSRLPQLKEREICVIE